MNLTAIPLLEKNLAETYMQYINTQKCHWNVEGPRFHSLHLMFEEQYQILAEYVDVIAERIRALGAYAPGSFNEFMDLSDIDQIKEKKIDADHMIECLLKGYETLVSNLNKTADSAAKDGDRGTEDLLTGHMEVHRKNMWMLRSMLSDKS